MDRNDWKGLAASLVLHALVLVALAFISAASSEPPPPEPIEIEIMGATAGPITVGRAVERGDQETARPVASPVPQKPRPARRQPTPPKERVPVRVPRQQQNLPDPDKVEQPREQVRPEPRNEPTATRDDEPREEAAPADTRTGGAREGTGGAATGAQGAGTDETRGSPFDIEGLNRDPLSAPLPAYREKVNAVITFRIDVDPSGRVVRALPTRKGNPTLEAAARDVLLRRWRFNALPANAPQVNQTGWVTFRFRLE